jgi:hypothetical protein
MGLGEDLQGVAVSEINLKLQLSILSDTITSVSYVLPTQTLWITANSPSPAVYDPRSGINVSFSKCFITSTFHKLILRDRFQTL